ncbi:unnamed protein product [Danaus chrysippus]|uniref:(African queen) hypothetical protein n=1 Tax=Danaus chrysippus TaxID=151541 RepID=A0A8J2W9G5_9NEOP|nr:unnamed protein product [Danaus chrysippus]
MSSLLRSTKFVRYFTGAARTLLLNSAKTAESNLLLNSKALSAANNVLLRDYATKKSESLEPLLQRLDSEVRRYGRITKRDIDEVFDEIRAKQDITSSQSLLVIRCCGELVPEELPQQRTLLVQKIWNVLTERGIPMDVSHYNALLRVYIENEHPFSPAQFLDEMEKKGLQPNRVTYQRLMWRYCQEGDVEGATKVLEKMRELNMPVSEPVLNALVMGHAFHGDTDGAKAVLETMAGAGLQPSNRTYALLACGYAKQGDIANVENIISTAKDKEIILADRDLLDIIEHLALSGHEDKIDQIFPYTHKGLGYNQEVCNLIFKLLNSGLDSTAKKLMKTMPKTNNTDDTLFKGAFYIKHLLKLNRSVDSIVETCRELQNEELIPNALYIATESSLTQGKCELAQRLFAEIEKDGVEIRPHYYWPLLVQKGKEHDEEGLLHIIREMGSKGIAVSGETLRDYIIPYLIENDTPQNVIVKLQIANVPVIHSARQVIIELLESGKLDKAAEIALRYRLRGQYSQITRPLINSLVKTKDVESFVKLLHVASSPQTQEDVSNDDRPSEDNNISEVGRILKIAVKNTARNDLTEDILSQALSKGLRIDTASAEEIQRFLGDKMTTNISELLSKLTSSSLELAPLEVVKRNQAPRSAAQLEQLLEQLKSKEGKNVNRLQKQVITEYIKENNVEKVTSIVEDLKNSPDFEINLSTLAQLFEFYCDNDMIEKAMEVKSQIAAKDKEFQLNKYKLVLMANALVRANRFDEAFQFLNDNKGSENPETIAFMVKSKIWQMLNNLAEQKDVEKVKLMTKTLLDNNYIEPTNVILGPSIKVHLLNDDIEGALTEFEHCCKQYRSTPWKGELMKTLILKEDANKLQWLADISTQIHGEVNILHDLVLAFVECGRLRQARRILETPGLHTRQKRLQDACQRYVEEGKSEYLEGLLEATKELSHIDRSNIFYQLLVTYCKADETDKALGLWTLLQEEGEIPSEKFLTLLGSHLISKNREVPFVMPEKKMQSQKPKVQVQKENETKKDQDIKKAVPKQTITDQVEQLTKEEKLSSATELALKSMEDGVFPKSNILKFLLRKLADEGDVERIKAIGNYLGESKRRKVTFDDKLTLAIFKQGGGSAHIETVLNAVNSAANDTELEAALRSFPRSNALASCITNEELVSKCNTVVEIAASKGYPLPANLLWMEYLLAGKDNEADALWNKCLHNSGTIVFRRLLQEAHVRKDPQLIIKMIKKLESNNNISPTSVGNAYSRLINLHLTDNNISEAKKTLEMALNNGLQLDHLNQSSLRKLKDLMEMESLRRGGRFYLCWVADSWPLRFATITHRQLWAQDIRQICNDLLEVMKNESGRPTNRFSLRLSSQLLRGLVRLYQRKVTVFVGDLCMINAHVMKTTHKKSIFEPSEHVVKRPQLPPLIFEIQPDEEAVEEKIQNSDNIVARVEDITLKEPTLLENRILLDDGFGELNPDQALQMMGERSLEMLMFPDNQAQHSVLDLPLDFSTEKSHDKSRLIQHEAQMERLSEHDVSVFGKSMTEAMHIGDFDKEIPEIPDLPHPDPHTDKTKLGIDNVKEKEVIKRSKKSRVETDGIVLEDSKDIISLLPTAQALLSRPMREVGRTLARYLKKIERTQEEILHKEQRFEMWTTTYNIEEPQEVDTSAGEQLQIEVSKEMDVPQTNIQAPDIQIYEPIDVADLPTQKLKEISSGEKRVSDEQRSPKKRRSGYITFRDTQQSTTLPTAVADDENVPGSVQKSRLTALLHKEGLADSEEQGNIEIRKTNSYTSETPLGSLDRTKVSLGESEKTTDSKRFIREEWGTQGTMHKIYKFIKSGVKPVNVDLLISSGPLISGYKRVIVARCFNSILKLKQHGFIRIYKDAETYEIKDITLGSKIIRD